jgi:RNA polymerase sigma-70 factor (ECF subfamily)
VTPPPAAEFSTFYRKYAPELYRFALFLTGEHAAAEDVVADTFAAAWTSSAPIVAVTVRAYLFTIARNLVRRRGREAGRQTELSADVPDAAQAVDAQVEAADTLRAVGQRLAQLPELDRTAVAIRAAGLSYDEIAETLGVSAGNARVRVHRARLILDDIR